LLTKENKERKQEEKYQTYLYLAKLKANWQPIAKVGTNDQPTKDPQRPEAPQSEPVSKTQNVFHIIIKDLQMLLSVSIP
jgi:hypothetical protein